MSKSLHGQFCIGPVFYNVTSVSVAFPLFFKSFLPFIFEPAPLPPQPVKLKPDFSLFGSTLHLINCAISSHTSLGMDFTKIKLM